MRAQDIETVVTESEVPEPTQDLDQNSIETIEIPEEAIEEMFREEKEYRDRLALLREEEASDWIYSQEFEV